METNVKKLSLLQMENLEGGRVTSKCAWGIGIGLAMAAVGTAGLILSGGTAAGLIMFGISRLGVAGGIYNACR